jgi:hypothetical protein
MNVYDLRKKQMKANVLIVAYSLLFIMSCGEGVVEVDERNYEEKIVIEGYLQPNQPVSKIRLTRNIPMNTNLRRLDLFIDNAEVKLVDLTNGGYDEYELTFNPDSLYYEYNGQDLQINYSGKYRLEVSATIDGKRLSTRSTTTVPDEGFKIRKDLSTDSLYFNKRGEDGILNKAQVVFQRSPETEFYAFSFIALEASTSAFIYNHPFVPKEIEEKDVEEHLDDFKYGMDTIFNTPESTGTTTLIVENYHTFFYGWYRVIAYAGDANYKDFFLTHSSVMEMDGNLHEPKMHFEGDGIGVFGSVIADTLFFKVLEDSK